MERQIDATIGKRGSDGHVPVDWTACDNGFCVGEGEATFDTATGTVLWLTGAPPDDLESALRDMIVRKARG